jgi:hypothetical protein
LKGIPQGNIMLAILSDTRYTITVVIKNDNHSLCS